MSAGVGIYAGDKELMGVELAAQLEGPSRGTPVGTASFKFFGLKVAFEIEVGGRPAGSRQPIAHPRADVLAALALPVVVGRRRRRSTARPPAHLRPRAAEDDGDVVWVRPDTSSRSARRSPRSTARWRSSARPCRRQERSSCTSPPPASATQRRRSTRPAVDWFAPAQFEVLGSSDKLARASFEEMTAGVTFGHRRSRRDRADPTT